jgi:hypothetical protein
MPQNQRLSGDEIEVRIWGFVVVTVTLILCFIVICMLYSITFVTQPIKAMAPIDQAYTKMLNDIVLLIVGGIGGVMSKRAVKAVANAVNPSPNPPAPTVSGPVPPAPIDPLPNFNWMGFTNPQLDETWVPPPPPTTPPDYIPPEAAEIAQERAAAKGEA